MVMSMIKPVKKAIDDMLGFIGNLSPNTQEKMYSYLKELISEKNISTLVNPDSVPIPELTLEICRQLMLSADWLHVENSTSVTSSMAEYLQELISRTERELGAPEEQFRSLDVPHKWLHLEMEILELLEEVSAEAAGPKDRQYIHAVQHLYSLCRFISQEKRFPTRKNNDELGQLLAGKLQPDSMSQLLVQLTMTPQGKAEARQDKERRLSGSVGCGEPDPEKGQAHPTKWNE